MNAEAKALSEAVTEIHEHITTPVGMAVWNRLNDADSALRSALAEDTARAAEVKPAILNILKALHDSEINASIATFWDSSYNARLGDDMNGFRAEKFCGSYEEAEAFLDAEARRLFPGCAYAKAAVGRAD